MEECTSRYRYSILKDRQNYALSTNSLKTNSTSQRLVVTRPNTPHRPSLLHTLPLPDRKTQQESFLATLYRTKHPKISRQTSKKQMQRFRTRMSQTFAEEGEFRAAGQELDSSCVAPVAKLLINTSVTNLVLDNNPLGDEGVTALAMSLRGMRLKELSLVSVHMGHRGSMALLSAVEHLADLQSLNLSSLQGLFRNKVSRESVVPLNALLRNPNCRLGTLKMDYVGLGSQGVTVLFERVDSAPLKVLSLAKNEIGNKCMGQLVASLSGMGIEHLDLSKNSLNRHGLRPLAEAIGRVNYGKNRLSTSLCKLLLGENCITSMGLEWLCREIGCNQTLQQLYLDGNRLDEGDRFFNIKYYLHKNWGLKRLSVSNTGLSCEHFKHLCEGMEQNRSLAELDISRNDLNHDSLYYLFLMLTKNKPLRELRMGHCKVSDGAILKHQGAILGGCLSRIEEVYLDNNYINDRGAAVLKMMVQRNPNLLKVDIRRNCASQQALRELTRVLKENESRRPFEHEINYFREVSDLYEEKRQVLTRQIEEMTVREENLLAQNLTAQIETKGMVEEDLKQRIAEEETQLAKNGLNRRRSSPFLTNV